MTCNVTLENDTLNAFLIPLQPYIVVVDLNLTNTHKVYTSHFVDYTKACTLLGSPAELPAQMGVMTPLANHGGALASILGHLCLTWWCNALIRKVYMTGNEVATVRRRLA